MNGRNTRWLTLPVFGLILLLLAACSLPLSVPVSGDGAQAPSQAAYSDDYATSAEPTDAATTAPDSAGDYGYADPAPASTTVSAGAPAPAATTDPYLAAYPTATTDPYLAPYPTDTTDLYDAPAPTAAATQQSQSGEPYLVTRQTAEVRRGPGASYELAYYLDSGVSEPVQGRSEDGQWWVIPAAGGGPGPLGWIRFEDVVFYGDDALVPVIQTPSNPADVPVHSDPGSPPADACVVEPLPGDLGPALVRLGPGEQFNATHRLGGWAEVINTQIGWYQILLGPGEVGWVDGQQVQTSGTCP